MKHFICLLTAATSLALPAIHAASIVENYVYNSGIPGGGAIPDGDPNGLADSRSIGGSAISMIDNVSVSLNITGSWNGDMYAYLQHSTGFAVLLNRVGRTAGNDFGFADTGFQVTLNDMGAAPDIHGQNAAGGTLVGTFGSDGRNVDPDLVLDTSPRTALLDSMNGLDANGVWTLFLADMPVGDTHSLVSWELEISGIPEPGTLSLLLIGAGLTLRRKR